MFKHNHAKDAHTHTRTCTHTHTHTHVHACTHTHTHTNVHRDGKCYKKKWIFFMYRPMFKHNYAQDARTCTHTRAHMHACTHTHTHCTDRWEWRTMWFNWNISLFILHKNSRLVSVAGVGDWIITLEGITARVEKKVERQTKAAFGWGKHPKWSAVLL